MVKEEKEVRKEEKKTLKYKVINVSQYYGKSRTMNPENVRDTALALLFEEHGDKIVAQINDAKTGDLKFVVKS